MTINFDEKYFDVTKYNLIIPPAIFFPRTSAKKIKIWRKKRERKPQKPAKSHRQIAKKK